ncbi:MAG TPA: site-specific integrase, partial [Bryobacteraceae bacterium]|nr:site-specific integrase [Bryobacteraceae bacterium]
MLKNLGRIYRPVIKRPDGTVKETSIWWLDYHVHGTRYRESSKSAVYEEAEQLLLARRLGTRAGVPAVVESMEVTVAELLDDVLLNYEINNKSLAWARIVDRHLRPFFGPINAGRVSSADLNRYIAQRRREGVKNATINREFTLLRRAFNMALKSTPPRIASGIQIPKLAENGVRKGFLTHDMFLAMRAGLPAYMQPVITFAYYTGCRKGEILGLRWSQVDVEAGEARLEAGETKNGEGRILPLSRELLEILIEQKRVRDQRWSGCQWVFCRRGERIRDFRGVWKAAAKACGLVDERGQPSRLFHDLRRKGIRNLVRSGVPERVAMMISGHRSRSVFDRYNIVSTDDLHQAMSKVEA